MKRADELKADLNAWHDRREARSNELALLQLGMLDGSVVLFSNYRRAK